MSDKVIELLPAFLPPLVRIEVRRDSSSAVEFHPETLQRVTVRLEHLDHFIRPTQGKWLTSNVERAEIRRLLQDVGLET